MPLAAHPGRAEQHLDRDVHAAGALVRLHCRDRAAAAGSPGGRAKAGTRNGASASSVTTQGESVVAKLLARKGPSGWYSHDWMSRADQSFTRQSPNRRSSACVERHRRAERVARPHEAADLHLVIQRPARPEHRRRVALPCVWPCGRRTGVPLGTMRRGPAVIADRDPLVVGQQRIVGPEHAAHVGGVVHRGVEIGVVARPGPAAAAPLRPAAPAAGRRGGGWRGRPRLPASSRSAACSRSAVQYGRAQRHQPVERGRGAGLRGPLRQPAEVARRRAPPPGRGSRRRSRRRPRGSSSSSPTWKTAERQVLDREVGMAVGRLDPGAASGVVRPVHARRRHRRRREARSPSGSSKEQEPNEPSPPRRASLSRAASRR